MNNHTMLRIIYAGITMNSDDETSQTPPYQDGADPSRSEKRTGGFGKPPTRTRFRKGKSGNPKGRPVEVRTLQESARWALRQKVRVTEGQIIKSLTIQEVILRKYAKDSRKTRFLFELAYNDAQFRPRSPELDQLIRIKRDHLDRLAAAARPWTAEELEDAAREYERSINRRRARGESP